MRVRSRMTNRDAVVYAVFRWAGINCRRLTVSQSETVVDAMLEACPQLAKTLQRRWRLPDAPTKEGR
jgi:hypothetical protein